MTHRVEMDFFIRGASEKDYSISSKNGKNVDKNDKYICVQLFDTVNIFIKPEDYQNVKKTFMSLANELFLTVSDACLQYDSKGKVLEQIEN